MKIIKSLFIFCMCISTLSSCSTFREAKKVLGGEKNKSTDEFLIKKQKPLTQPPEYTTIPEPGVVENRSEKNERSIEAILRNSKTDIKNSKTKPSTTEESILNQIKK